MTDEKNDPISLEELQARRTATTRVKRVSQLKKSDHREYIKQKQNKRVKEDMIGDGAAHANQTTMFVAVHADSTLPSQPRPTP